MAAHSSLSYGQVGAWFCGVSWPKSWGCVQKPCSETEALPIVRTHQDDVCGLDEPGSEILTPSPGNTAQALQTLYQRRFVIATKRRQYRGPQPELVVSVSQPSGAGPNYLSEYKC
jgi:hypothetical protein